MLTQEMITKLVQAKQAIEALSREVKELQDTHDIDRIDEMMEVAHLRMPLRIALDAINKTGNRHAKAVILNLQDNS